MTTPLTAGRSEAEGTVYYGWYHCPRCGRTTEAQDNSGRRDPCPGCRVAGAQAQGVAPDQTEYVVGLTREIDRQDSHIRELTATLQDQDQQVRDLTSALEARDQEIARLQQALAEAEAQQ